MTALDESHLFPPPARLRQLDFWMALAALLSAGSALIWQWRHAR
jgi:hypothetical protein